MTKQRAVARTIKDYFFRRETVMRDLDKERDIIAYTLLNLIPKQLKGYKSKSFSNLRDMSKFLQYLYDHNNGEWPVSETVREPKDYGFKSKNDAHRNMKLLRGAWTGIIDLKLDASNPCLEVRYKLADNVSG